MRDAIEAFVEAQRDAAFLWAPVLLGIGIGIYFALPFEPVLPAMMIAPFWVLAYVLSRKLLLSSLRLSVIGLLLIAAGLILASARAHRVGAPVLTGQVIAPVEGRIVHIDRSATNRLRITLDDPVIYGQPPGAVPARVRISLRDTAPPFPVGTRVLVHASLSPPSPPVEPGAFDFRRFAWFARLGGIGYALGPVMRSDRRTDAQPLHIAPLRMALADGIRARVEGPAGAFAAAIFTGDRSGIDPAITATLRASNLSHLLAISGLHMGLLTGFVFWSLRWIMSVIPAMARISGTKKIAAMAAICAGVAYMILSGASVATQRAAIMATVLFVAILVDRPAVTLRAVAVAALIVLFLQPESLTQVGFQMSFAATIALVAGFRVLRRLDWWRVPASGWHGAVRWVAALAVSSALAGAATAPFSAFHFNAVAQYGLLANLAALPLMGFVVMPAGVLAALLAPIGLETPALMVAGWGIDGILAISAWVGALPEAVLPVSAGGPWVLPALALGALTVLLVRGRVRWLGLPIMLGGFVLWGMTERPAVLIDGSGRVLGVMTGQGRALSRARGAGFAAATWLRRDGDPANQRTASGRLGAGDGPVVLAGNGARLWLVNAQTPPGECRAQDLVLGAGAARWRGPCQRLDAVTLQRSGGIAVHPQKDGYRLLRSVPAREARLWQGRGA